MIVISGLKYACEKCFKGHRTSTCKHTDRPLLELKKPGRPVTQCEHCRDLRKTKQIHVKCLCETRFPSDAPEKQSSPIPPTHHDVGFATSSDSDDVGSPKAILVSRYSHPDPPPPAIHLSFHPTNSIRTNPFPSNDGVTTFRIHLIPKPSANSNPNRARTAARRPRTAPSHASMRSLLPRPSAMEATSMQAGQHVLVHHSSGHPHHAGSRNEHFSPYERAHEHAPSDLADTCDGASTCASQETHSQKTPPCDSSNFLKRQLSPIQSCSNASTESAPSSDDRQATFALGLQSEGCERHGDAEYQFDSNVTLAHGGYADIGEYDRGPGQGLNAPAIDQWIREVGVLPPPQPAFEFAQDFDGTFDASRTGALGEEVEFGGMKFGIGQGWTFGAAMQDAGAVDMHAPISWDAFEPQATFPTVPGPVCVHERRDGSSLVSSEAWLVGVSADPVTELETGALEYGFGVVATALDPYLQI